MESEPMTALDPLFTTSTSTQLLNALRDPGNHVAWDAYIARFRPILVAYGRKLGLRDADAEDVAQHALLEFSQAYRAGKYERAKGRLRSWLFGICHNQLRNWQRRTGRAGAAATPDDVLQQLPAEDALSAIWDEQWRDTILHAALRQIAEEVQPQTLAIFKRFAFDDLSAEQVAAEFDTTANAVFSAKRRVLRRLRELMAQYDDSAAP